MAAREHDYEPGDTIRGDGAEYLVQAVLGSGGMGAVYLVKDKNIGRPFVLKVLHQSLAHRQDLIERFEVEARALGHLSHPGIIEIFQLNRIRDDKRMPYYLMEVLTGESLADSLRRHRKLDLFTALGIATKLLHALDHAHERGIVHRDIKPDNIFLHRGSSSEPVVKLLDFGILKLIASADNPGIFIGTPRYCAPEQLKAGPPIGPKADLYSVGVVLFQMLTSHLPFEGYGRSLQEMVHTLIVEAPPLSKHGKFPPALVALVASALSKEPDKRPADAFTFASELRKIRRDFAPDREDPHTHVTAEVIADGGRPRRDPSQITVAHLAAPTAPDADMGRLMEALRNGEEPSVEAVLHGMENRAPVAITGFESTAQKSVPIPAIDRVAATSERDAHRDAPTALPSSGKQEGGPGSVRYVTNDPAPGGSARPMVRGQSTVPMARPLGTHHTTEPMAARPVRLPPASHDAQTPAPLAIDDERAALPADRANGWGRRALARVERFVPLRALPIALALALVGVVVGVVLLRARGLDLTARAMGSSAPEAAPVTPVVAPLPAALTSTAAEAATNAAPMAGLTKENSSAAAPSTAVPVGTPVSATRPAPRTPVARPGISTSGSTPTGAPAPKKLLPAEVGFE